MINQNLKFRNRYRIKSPRAQWWDYSREAAYFVTICTKKKVLYFGNIVKQQMVLPSTGELVERIWKKIPFHFPKVSLGAYVIMPNHVHGIIILGPSSEKYENVEHEEYLNEKTKNLKIDYVERLHATSLQRNEDRSKEMGKISPKSGSLSTVIRSYKSAVTKYANEQNLKHAWQAKFYDRIIRSVREYKRIEEYIILNPLRWDEDKYFSYPND